MSEPRIEDYLRNILDQDRAKIQEKEQARDREVLQRWGVPVEPEKKDDLQEACKTKKEEVETDVATNVNGDKMSLDDEESDESEESSEKEDKKEDSESEEDEDEEEDVDLSEVAPPDAEIEKWAEEPKVKRAFRKKYGERWKQVMYGHAWNMFNKKSESEE